nr:MAG TPA: CIII protein family protein [Caudoviricetes sp.]
MAGRAAAHVGRSLTRRIFLQLKQGCSRRIFYN